ncbi:MAG: LytR/AlgR family response regulator transcription factor [Rhizomicrobium sp.]
MRAFTNISLRPPRALMVAFVYWLLFLLALEPGNIMNTGGRLDPGQEFLRILGASLLGACSGPVLLAMVRRFPVEGQKTWRNGAIQIASCIGIAAVLVAISCVLADWFLPAEHRPFLTALPQELEGNGPLVAFCTAGFTALAHARIFRRIAGDEGAGPTVGESYLAYIDVKTRGREFRVDLRDVDWIESQGNYLALHCGRDTYLLRMGLAALEAKLDPQRFVRIHRRVIVALDRVRALAPLGAGDAGLHLSDGTELRLSRTYRASFIAARAAPVIPAAGTQQEGSLEVASLRSYNSCCDR